MDRAAAARAWAVLLVCGSGCFQPSDPGTCQIRCSSATGCPHGFQCLGDGFCHETDDEALCNEVTPDASALGMAAIDALEGPPCRLTAEMTVPQDIGSCAGTQSCYAGECLLDVGETCSEDGQCGSGTCLCLDAECAGRTCAAVFDADGSFDVPPGVGRVDVELWAGGGSGGGSDGQDNVFGGGGGGGAWAKATLSVGAGESIAITVGIGGPRPTSQNVNGNPGGTSRFGTLLEASGGQGGGCGGSCGAGLGGAGGSSTAEIQDAGDRGADRGGGGRGGGEGGAGGTAPGDCRPGGPGQAPGGGAGGVCGIGGAAGAPGRVIVR